MNPSEAPAPNPQAQRWPREQQLKLAAAWLVDQLDDARAHLRQVSTLASAQLTRPRWTELILAQLNEQLASTVRGDSSSSAWEVLDNRAMELDVLAHRAAQATNESLSGMWSEFSGLRQLSDYKRSVDPRFELLPATDVLRLLAGVAAKLGLTDEEILRWLSGAVPLTKGALRHVGSSIAQRVGPLLMSGSPASAAALPGGREGTAATATAPSIAAAMTSTDTYFGPAVAPHLVILPPAQTLYSSFATVWPALATPRIDLIATLKQLIAQLAQQPTQPEHAPGTATDSGAVTRGRGPAYEARTEPKPAAAAHESGSQSATDSQAVVIEFVELVFRRIAEDPITPQQVREVLLTLQVPFARLVVLEGSDPATITLGRDYLNRAASAAVGWTPRFENKFPLLGHLTNSAQSLLAATDPALGFQTARAALEAFLLDQGSDEVMLRVRTAVEHAEKLDAARAKARHCISRLLERFPVESYLKTFLVGPWSELLAQHELHSADSEGPLTALTATLVWSVQPKIKPEDQRALAAKLPSLLGRLRQVIGDTALTQDQVNAFFQQLMVSHAQALKAYEIAMSRDPTATIDAIRRNMSQSLASYMAEAGSSSASPDALRQLAKREGVVLEVLGRFSRQPTVIAEQTTSVLELEMALNEALQVGQWYRLDDTQGGRLVQLRWQSPGGSAVVFSDEEGEILAAMRETLLAYAMRRSFRAAEDAPLTERALAVVEATAT